MSTGVATTEICTGCVGIVRKLFWRGRGCWRVRRLGLLLRKQKLLGFCLDFFVFGL
ncbi:hypothetical protein V6Z11_A04G112200 [Gossypium hirsutum]